ncbi:hypothetical protein SAMN05216371_8303 [Streptomyces sp. TLI_053]|uniref:hypothetical protein n=1 Tax=Streptomyces sp. TLI_053 TaxID=1855352 RepID=UPI00087C9703|nr:hypothetical protein [Streptomyces sp. TLI_053]SDT83470.1 hypothetical protein SAMN05216371_8303 [Streptomyces sp. TLI_053]
MTSSGRTAALFLPVIAVLALGAGPALAATCPSGTPVTLVDPPVTVQQCEQGGGTVQSFPPEPLVLFCAGGTHNFHAVVG